MAARLFLIFFLRWRAAAMEAAANGSQNQKAAAAPPANQQAPRVPSPPQWAAPMAYPGATMMMAAPGLPPPPPPPYAPHYIPYHQMPPLLPQYHQRHPSPPPASADENRTLWVGDLQFWMDENYLQLCFGHTGEVALVKVIRNKQTGHSEGYGFVEFYSRSAAEKVLQTYSSLIMPNTDQLFRINWATFSMGDKRSDGGPDHSIFVGDLAPDVTDTLLQELFSAKYPSVKGAKVVVDPNTGRSKGYGFVRFGEESEKSRAITEMNGEFCSSRAMRIGAATPRKSSGSASNGSQGLPTEGDPTNTTVFVGGLDPNVSEDELRQPFSECGDIASIKIPAGKQCGFVQFVQRSSAEEALQKLNGTTIGKQVVRLSWGRSPANRQVRIEAQSQWNNGGYFGGQFYGGYAYASPHDPAMYAAAYGAYPPLYGNQPQVS
ncbi:polyadenylate-binding protein RBP47-like [Wolffia australiana]